ncbi:hypothetical protein PROFUN_16661 [Planoprotostelium fungivorum]|uniref:Uncharacterized protein n=1 Tax=Planoprotostelium fungivorum TaxID=1890364 RepID=A0A2P6MPS8_9EUKA|nr:hypothetical protein PROFUN_16661 [Planoprotostelium fungivorum]
MRQINPLYNFELLPRERGSGQYGPRTRIETECERGTNANYCYLASTCAWPRSLEIEARSDHNSCKARLSAKTKIFQKQPSQLRHPGRKDLETRDERFEQELSLQYSRLASISRKSRTRITNYLFKFCKGILSRCMTVTESVVAECPHEVLMAEAEEEGFSNYRVVNRHFQLNTQASASPRFPPRLHKASSERANAYKCFAEDYQTEHRRQAFSARRVVDKSAIIPPFTMMLASCDLIWFFRLVVKWCYWNMHDKKIIGNFYTPPAQLLSQSGSASITVCFVFLFVSA